jgi:hypothetical protein
LLRHIIENVSQYAALISAQYSGCLFRGQRASSWALEPGLDRALSDEGLRVDRLRLAGSLLEDFNRLGRPYLNGMPSDDWEWLALAQHHGLLTPLLDWTTNPLVALFFAVDHDDNQLEGSAVWCHRAVHIVNPKTFPQPVFFLNYIMTSVRPAPLRIDSVVIYFPVHISPRISAQSACFSVHPPTKEPWSVRMAGRSRTNARSI